MQVTYNIHCSADVKWCSDFPIAPGILELSTSSWEDEGAGQSHSSGGAQRGPSRFPLTGHYDYRGMPQEGPTQGVATPTDRCKVSRVYQSSIPSGKTEVDYITVHKDLSVKPCIAECCKLGAALCQYAWLFTEQCILIGCSQQNATKCLPLNMPTLQDTSTYVSLHVNLGMYYPPPSHHPQPSFLCVPTVLYVLPVLGK